MDIETFPGGSISIVEQINGETHRRTINPGDDISAEPKAVRDAAGKLWTDEVLSEWSHPISVPSTDDVKAWYAEAIDRHVEAQAKSLGYKSAANLAGYVGSSVASWDAEAQAFVAWRDDVWVKVFAMLETADYADPPSLDSVIGSLPDFSYGED